MFPNIFFVIVLLFLSIITNGNGVNGAKILSIFHTPSKSHMLLAQPLMLELAKSGHEVTIVTPFPIKNPPENIQCIVLTGVEHYYDYYWEIAFEHTEDSPVEMLKGLISETIDLTNLTLTHPNVKKLLASNEKYDLVYMEMFLNDAFLGFAHLFDCPVIGMSTIGVSPWALDVNGSPAPMSFVPNGLLSFKDKMNLKERLINILFTMMERFFTYTLYLPAQEKLYNDNFPDPKPSFAVIRGSKVSMVFLNTHFSLSVPRPYLPNMIEVGGMQVSPNPDPLTPDLTEFIESAEHGVIFFSMGGNLWPSRMPITIRTAILNSLGKIKQKIIWKWDDESLVVDEKKFLIRKWLPQNSILSHPNVKLFITHGGLLSMTESIYYGVPMLGTPVFGDQMTNMNIVEESGWGIRVDYKNITETSWDWALKELLNNPKYRQNVQHSSKLLRDQPLSPLETAKFWVEYVIRHKGAPHIKSMASQLSTIELYNIDAYFVIITILLLIILVPIIVMRKCFRLICGTEKTKIKKN